VGVYSRVKAGDWSDLIKDVNIVDAANLLIASGAFVMIIGFVGCCGAVKQLRPLLVVVCKQNLKVLYIHNFFYKQLRILVRSQLPIF